MFGKKQIYLDYASLTPIDKRVVKEMELYSDWRSGGYFTNPSSLYASGVRARSALRAARAQLANFFHAHPDEFIFTGSGTEANNMALLGVVKTATKIPHIIASSIEHSSVLEPLRALKAEGRITYDLVPILPHGVIDLDAFKSLLKPETVLVSIMLVNNEIGTVQPLHDVVKIVRDFRQKQGQKLEQKQGQKEEQKENVYPLIHTDASQAPLYLDINLEKIGVDLMTLDSHKVYGPRGVGVLFARRHVLVDNYIAPIMYGGGQEQGLRSGTENVPGIMGFVKALEIGPADVAVKNKETARILELRTHLIDQLKKISPALVLNGAFDTVSQKAHDVVQIAHIVNVTFPDVDHEYLLFQLDAKGIAVSTKSSCLREAEESYVLSALRAAVSACNAASHALLHAQHHLPPHTQHTQKPAQSLRFSLGRFTTKKDIDVVVKTIHTLISR